MSPVKIPQKSRTNQKRSKTKERTSQSVQKRARQLIATGKCSQKEALEIFDALATVKMDFMVGQWRGSGLHTNHAMDGLLENYDWHGKEFLDPDHVHPLVCHKKNGELYMLHPALMPMGWALTQPWLKKPFMRVPFRLGRVFLSTRKSTARLRMTEHRGKVSATMCYDHLPIHDVFRQVDANTVLGLMDYKQMQEPFFFALRRLK